MDSTIKTGAACSKGVRPKKYKEGDDGPTWNVSVVTITMFNVVSVTTSKIRRGSACGSHFDLPCLPEEDLDTLESLHDLLDVYFITYRANKE